MLANFFICIAVVLSLASAGQYAWSALRGLSRPNPVSWFFWGAVPLITFFAQLYKEVGLVSIVALALGIANLGIMAIAINQSGLKIHLTPTTVACAIAAVVGVAMWLITSEPVTAIVCSIIADIFASIPTLIKTYRDQKSEYPTPYLISSVVMILTLCSVESWHFAAYGFAVYCLAINVIIYALAVTPYRPFQLLAAKNEQLLRNRI